MPGVIVRYHTASVHLSLPFVLLEPTGRSTLSKNTAQQRRDLLGRQLPTHEAVKAFLCSELQNVTEETFAILLLDTKYRILHFYQTPNATLAIAYPREVIQRALRYKAHTIVLARGFPSEEPHDNRAEIKLVKTLKELLALVDIHLLDHISVGPSGCVSLAGSGRL
ncbi:JAB domain-containing protein [Paenalcaligenes sp. Me131]|uniref:JAB domain-containing protein n=1 Tax=Paenalcaligenes sp. Me131 TaxID=3392636 RepID=UPI003D27CD52